MRGVKDSYFEDGGPETATMRARSRGEDGAFETATMRARRRQEDAGPETATMRARSRPAQRPARYPSEDSAHVGAIGLALEPLAWWIGQPGPGKVSWY